ncbi:MAG: SDR family NAD(P)-dependent oxidoreductase [Bacteroidota bacterium]
MNYIITGGHTGMGLALTKKLRKEGHQIGLIVRSTSRKKETQALFQGDEGIDLFVADLSKRDDIEQVAQQIQNKWEKVDGLFNNAGLLLDKLYYSDYGNELQLEVNGISPYLLTKALKPLLDKAEQPFVVNTATGGLNNKKSVDIPAFRKPEKFTKLLGSYMDSKLILVLLMNDLSKDKDWAKVRFVNVNPGAIKTKMTAGSGMPFWLKPIRNLLFKSPEHGAKNLYQAAFDSKYQESGIFISEGKIRPMKYVITKAEIAQLFA